MKEQLTLLFQKAISILTTNGTLPIDLPIDIHLMRSKTKEQGDFSTNIAMVLGKRVNLKPCDLAEKIIANLPQSEQIVSVAVAGPGFINIFLKTNREYDVIARAIVQGEDFGKSTAFKDKRIHIEFVSANPTGPLHVGHGRGAAYGATTKKLLEAIGYHVHREYYVNDAGRQMRNLAISIWLRYLQLYQREFQFPNNIYRGDYIIDIARLLQEKYGNWFLESVLYQNGWIEAGVDLLTQHGFTDKKEGALWFRATDLGDEKDRVLVRQNGQPTYFASDVAYHTYKYDQNYDWIIDVFGADHHGYLPRINAFLKGLGKDTNKLKILLVQFAFLYRGTEKISMSTRAGEFVTLRALRDEVGNDAARFFYIMRKPDQHLDFDLELAKSTSNDNPVYYIQYAHARICSVWRQLTEKNILFDQS